MHDESAVPVDAEAVLATFRDASVMVVATEGPEHRFAAANAVVRRFANGRALIGLPFAEALPDADGQGFTALFTHVYETGEPVTNHRWRVQMDLPDGGFTEFYASFSLAPWRRPDGSIRGVIGHAVDVTDEVRRRMAAEAASAEAERRDQDARALVGTLQDSLLPTSLPVVPGLQTAGHYLLAEDDTAAGGDWLDVVPLPEGRVALVVGDVVGHGVAASALMGQLRAVLNEHLCAGAGVRAALEALDQVATRMEKAHGTTVVVAELDPATGVLTYCTAGHHPPLILDHETRYLPTSGAGPLASGRGFATASVQMAPDDLVLLYSDGIIERPRRSPSRATVELAAVARRTFDGEAFRDEAVAVDRVCAQSIEMLVRETGYADDITMLAAQRVATSAPLEIHARADLSELGPIRDRVAAWLRPFDISRDAAAVLQQAVSECAANVVDHAYRGDEDGKDRPLTVTMCLEPDGELVAQVIDAGRWRRGAGALTDDGRGRGLMIVRRLISSVRIEHDPDEADPAGQPAGAGRADGADDSAGPRRRHGTCVTLRQPLTRAVRIVSDAHAPLARPRPADHAFATRLDGTTLHVRGAVDAASAPAFSAALLTLVNGRQPVVSADLSEVALLGSAGVQALVDIFAGMHGQGVALTLVAAPGSFAERVLDLSQLPYQASASDVRPGR